MFGLSGSVYYEVSGTQHELNCGQMLNESLVFDSASFRGDAARKDLSENLKLACPKHLHHLSNLSGEDAATGTGFAGCSFIFQPGFSPTYVRLSKYLTSSHASVSQLLNYYLLLLGEGGKSRFLQFKCEVCSPGELEHEFSTTKQFVIVPSMCLGPSPLNDYI